MTNDALPKTNLVTDGAGLYFNKSSFDRSLPMRMSARGGEVVPINTAVTNPKILDISPQSELLVSSAGGETGNDPFWVVSAGSERRIGDVLGHDAVWAPNGALVFVRGDDIYIAEHYGANPRKLATAPGPPFSIKFSPDGSRMTFTIGDPNKNSTMWEAQADGSAMRPIFPRPGWNAPPEPCCGKWTPDGKYFVFENGGDIWIVADLFGRFSEPVQLTSGPLRFHDPLPSKDGKKLFVVGVQPQAQLVRYDATSGDFVPFLGGISAGDVDFSRDGQWVTYVTYPDQVLWRSKVDGSERLRLTSSPMQCALAHWSPDGKQIAFAGWQPGERWKLWLVSKDGGKAQVLTTDNAAEADPTWSPDGNTLAFVRSTQPKGPSIALLDLKTLTRSQLSGSEGLLRPRWSPDGRYLVAMAGDSNALMIYDFRRRKWRRLASGLGTIGYVAWASDSVYIYFDSVVRHDSTYLRVKASDGKTEQLANLKNLRRYFGIWGLWSGLAPGAIPLFTRDTSTQEIYTLDWRLP